MSTRRQPAIPVTGGVTLRPWMIDDAAELVLAHRDPLIRQYSARLADDRADARERIAGWSRRWQQSLGGCWALRADGPAQDLLGTVQFGLVDDELRTGSAGYWLLPHARGTGLASTALARATDLVFARLGWFRIELTHAVENERSCAVARRAGYPLEGTMRAAMVYPADGRRSDEHLHARLRTDPPPPVLS